MGACIPMALPEVLYGDTRNNLMRVMAEDLVNTRPLPRSGRVLRDRCQMGRRSHAL